MRSTAVALILLASVAHALQVPLDGSHFHDHSDPEHMEKVHGVYRELWPEGKMPMPLVPAELLQDTVSAKGGYDAFMAGLATYAHLPYGACLSPFTHVLPDNEELMPDIQSGSNFDIAFVGIPFDTATSYRPGARFGPGGIREGSKRIARGQSWNVPMGLNPFEYGHKILDCGDIPVTQFDNEVALEQMEKGYDHLLGARVRATNMTTDDGTIHSRPLYTQTGRVHPKIITLGGDHTLTLPVLRSLNKVYGPVSVIHFDSHIDTWEPQTLVTKKGVKKTVVDHGSYFWWAAQEGLVRNGSSTHAGIRSRIQNLGDYVTDRECGFRLDHAYEIDQIGTQGIIDNIRKTVAGNPVYLSIDIDTLDPSAAPATGTPEIGGWTSRELRQILRGLEGLDIVGADIVEVAPAYDNQAMLTQTVAAELMFEVLSVLVKRGPLIDTAR